jgi:hypothetical protein
MNIELGFIFIFSERRRYIERSEDISFGARKK